MRIVCADVGSVPNDKFAWACASGANGRLPSQMASHVAATLNAGESVALGFECPLFVPIPVAERELGRARVGEGARSWSAGAGSGALATGLVQVGWVLSEVRRLLRVESAAFLDWADFRRAPSPSLLVWEAFVTGTAKGQTHADDAYIGVKAFESAMPDPSAETAVTTNCPVHSLAGSALVRAGWSTNLALLEQPCLVIRASADVA